MEWLKNLKFRNKLMLSFIILTLIPMLIFGYYAYHVASKNIQEKTVTYSGNILDDLNKDFESLIHEAALVTRYPIGDKELEELLRKDYYSFKHPLYEKTQDIKKYKFYINHLMNIYLKMDYLLLYPINQPSVIGHSNLNKSFFTKNIPYMEDKWYQKTINADGYWVYTGVHTEEQIIGKPVVISISRMIKDVETQQSLAVVKVMIDVKSINAILNNQEEASGFSYLLIDENQELVTKSASFPAEIIDEVVRKKQSVSNFKDKYLINQSNSSETGWTIYAVTNRSVLLKELAPIKSGLVVLIVATMFVSLILTYLMTSSLVRPLERLKHSMKKVKHGEWRKLKLVEGKDEIGELTKHYNKMLNWLDEYVELIIKKERQKKDLEFKSLQAQINPHFLYNTLNSIKWCIYMDQKDHVTEMLDSLVYILRFISNRKGDVITIQEEREFLNHYLSIIGVRFQGEFEVIWEFSDEINDCEIPIMLLQPIVENAIVHGLEKEQSDRKVWLKGYKRNDRMILEIEDNGIGFQMVDSATKSVKFSSIGLENVINRLKLIYEEDAKIKIHSLPNEGTNVIIDLPLQIGNEKTR